MYVLINPILDRVTHIVVKEDLPPNTMFVVSVYFVVETIADTIRLRCSKAELEKMDLFVKTRYIKKKVPEMVMGLGGQGYGVGSSFYMPYVLPEQTVLVPEKHLQIPLGELAVQRGTRVEATDGYVGNVDEFVVNPENYQISHLIMREGHLWGKKDIIFPVSAMGEARQDTLFLKLDKHQIESLPTFPVHRLWS